MPPKYRKKSFRKRNFKKRRIIRKQYKRGLVPIPRRNIELKYNDVTISQSMTVNGGFTLLNGVTEGSGPSDRIGRRVTIKQIYFNGEVSYNNTAGASCKMALILDKGNNGASPVVCNNTNLASIFDGASGACYPWTPIALWNSARYVILGQIKFNMNQQVTAQSVHKQMKMFKKFYKGLRTIYNDTGATIASINSGALYLVTMSNQATTFPTVSGNVRIRYSDD